MPGPPICPHCNEPLTGGVMPWNMGATVAGSIYLILCPHCSRVLGTVNDPKK